VEPAVPEHQTDRGERMPLVYCTECRRPFQRSRGNPTVIRAHRKAPGSVGMLVEGNATPYCIGSLRLPIEQGSNYLVHWILPEVDGQVPPLQCCGKKPSEVPAFDRFTPDPQACTCPAFTKS
jgi:hypothetical protein